MGRRKNHAVAPPFKTRDTFRARNPTLNL